jgi:hypothetical protein
MKSNCGLFLLTVVFLFFQSIGLNSQGLFSSFETGAGLSKTFLVDKDKSVLNTFQVGMDFSNQWQTEVHVTVWESNRFEYDFGLSLTKSLLDYRTTFINYIDLLAETETFVIGQQENWDVDITGGIFYKLISKEKSQLMVGPEFIYRKTLISLIDETVTSDTIIDPAVHDIFNREGRDNTLEVGALAKYVYYIKPGIGIFLKGFGKIPFSQDTLTWLGVEDVFRRLHAGMTLGLKIRIKQ